MTSHTKIFSTTFHIVLLACSAMAQVLQDETTFPQPPFTVNLTTVNVLFTPPQFLSNGSFIEPQSLAPSQRQVSYADVGGLAIIEGDVVLGTVADVRAATVNPTRRVRGISILHSNKYNKWPLGIVEFKYESEDFKQKRKEQFQAAINLWKNRLPFLDFRESSPSPDRIAGGGAITLISGPPGGTTSYSPLGRAGWDIGSVFQFSPEANVMTLAQCDAPLEACAGHYAHEIGHTLGLHHEHNRPDRDLNVIVHCDRIPGYTSASPEVKKALCSAYDKANPIEADFSGPYDRNSIMHYPPYPGVDGQKIMEGLPPFPDPKWSTAPTRYDVLKVCNLYFENCQAICGDGIVSPGEVCDDGNNIDNDGCAANCQSYTNIHCGNGVLDEGEECDSGTDNGKNKNPGHCTLDCKIIQPGTEPPSGGSCGIQQCNPTSGQNQCHSTSSCIEVEGSLSTPRYMCACRHGFRAFGPKPGDATKQIRIPGTKWPSQRGRVFVNPGEECIQLCDAWTLGADGCTEVQQEDKCF